MIKYAKFVGLTIFAIVFFAFPALFVLSIIFNWGILLIIILGGVVGVEMFLFVIAVEALADGASCKQMRLCWMTYQKNGALLYRCVQ